MAYTEIKFEEDFKLAVEMRVGGEQKAKGVVDGTTNSSWKLYENTRTAPLGLQVFGRHKKNPSDMQGEPGIELYGDVFPKIKEQRGLVPWKRTESDKRHDKRIAPFKEDLKHPTYPERQKTPMEFNFGVASHKSGGGILMMGNDSWHLNVNDSWVLGGVHAHQPFYIAFDLSYDNVFTDTYKHNLTITGRELLGLLLGGYELQKGHDDLGGVMVCTRKQLADDLTLVDYSATAQIFEDPLKGMDVLMQHRDNPQLSVDLRQKITDAINQADDVRKTFVATARAAKINLKSA